MGTFSGRSAAVGFGRQTAKASALTVPKYEIAMGGGSAEPQRSTQELPWTSDSQEPIGFYVNMKNGRVNGVQVPVLPQSCVPLLQGILGNRAAPSGAGPYTHVVTPGDTLPWMTWFYEQPGGNYWTLPDIKLTDWALGFAPGAPLTCTVNGIGAAFPGAPSSSKWGSAAVAEGVQPFFTYIGATMKLDAAASPAATTVHNLLSGTLTCNRNLELLQTDDVVPHDLAENQRTIGCQFQVLLEDNTLLNAVIASSDVVYGALDFKFIGSDGAAATTRSLELSIPKVEWNISEVPPADPGGAAARYTLTGNLTKAASGASVTATVINGDSGTNY